MPDGEQSEGVKKGETAVPKQQYRNTSVREGAGGGGAPCARAEIPLQPMENMVKQVVPLQPMENHAGADIHRAASG